MFTLVSASESLDCGKTGALLHHRALLYAREPEGSSSLVLKAAADEVAWMVLGTLKDPEPVAPSGLRSRILWSTPALSLDEALEEVTGWGRIGSDRDI